MAPPLRGGGYGPGQYRDNDTEIETKNVNDNDTGLQGIKLENR